VSELQYHVYQMISFHAFLDWLPNSRDFISGSYHIYSEPTVPSYTPVKYIAVAEFTPSGFVWTAQNRFCPGFQTQLTFAMHNPIASMLLKTTAAKRLEKRRYSASMIWDVILHRSALSSERQFGPLIWFIKSLASQHRWQCDGSSGVCCWLDPVRA